MDYFGLTADGFRGAAASPAGENLDLAGADDETSLDLVDDATFLSTVFPLATSSPVAASAIAGSENDEGAEEARIHSAPTHAAPDVPLETAVQDIQSRAAPPSASAAAAVATVVGESATGDWVEVKSPREEIKAEIKASVEEVVEVASTVLPLAFKADVGANAAGTDASAGADDGSQLATQETVDNDEAAVRASDAAAAAEQEKLEEKAKLQAEEACARAEAAEAKANLARASSLAQALARASAAEALRAQQEQEAAGAAMVAQTKKRAKAVANAKAAKVVKAEATEKARKAKEAKGAALAAADDETFLATVFPRDAEEARGDSAPTHAAPGTPLDNAVPETHSHSASRATRSGPRRRHRSSGVSQAVPPHRPSAAAVDPETGIAKKTKKPRGALCPTMRLPSKRCLLVLLVLALVAYFRPRAQRAHNFAAGPSALFDGVLLEAQRSLFDHAGSGMSLLEMAPNTGHSVQSVLSSTAGTLRHVLDIPPSYSVLYMHGGPHVQYAAAAMNLDARKAAYIITGAWSSAAAIEAEKLIDSVQKIDGIAINARTGMQTRRSPLEWIPLVDDDVEYIYICASEAAEGFEMLSDVGLDAVHENGITAPIIADFTGTLLSRPIDVSRYGIIFASGGTNIGVNGMSIILIRPDLLELSKSNAPNVPLALSYHLVASTREAIMSSRPIASLSTMPPMWPIYIHGLVLQHLDAQYGRGRLGILAVEARAVIRSNAVYSVIDQSRGFYVSVIDPASRSRMSVVFKIHGGGGDMQQDLEKSFVDHAASKGLLELIGHPTQGGLRVTLYNGVRDESVKRVVSFMRSFARTHRW